MPFWQLHHQRPSAPEFPARERALTSRPWSSGSNPAPIQDVLAQASQLLKDRRLVVVFGDRLSLTSFALAEPIRSSLVGAATTEDEGVELVLRTRPDLLICSSDLEAGYGMNLLRRVKA